MRVSAFSELLSVDMCATVAHCSQCRHFHNFMQLFRIRAITIIIIIPFFFLFMAHSACPCEAHQSRPQCRLVGCKSKYNYALQIHSTPIWSHVIVHLTTVFQLRPIVNTLSAPCSLHIVLKFRSISNSICK